MTARPWMVSVLSTAYDLKEYREDVITLLKNKNFQVSAYEEPEFPVEPDMHSHKSCLVALKRADIAIVIINKRSGGIYLDLENEENRISITEAECLEAIKNEIPVFFFVNQKAYDELHAYKKNYKSFCDKHKYVSKSLTKMKKYRKEYDDSYECTYVEKLQTLKFIDNIQMEYKKYGISNWMSFYNDRNDFIREVEGKLAGYSRKLLQRLAKSQRDTLLDKHTSTALGMSLKDVFRSEYYMEAPHKIVSGKSNIMAVSESLSNELNEVIRTDNSILIYGDAGYGKTTILAKCFDEHVDRLEKNPSYDIPLFLPLKNKGNDYHFDIEKYIEEELANARNSRLCHTRYPYLDLRQMKIYFYCDGFDEIAETLTAIDLMRIRNTSIFAYPLILTCRQQYTMRYLDEFNFADKFSIRIQMERWNTQIARDYIKKFCDIKGVNEQQKENILKVVDNSIDLQQVLDSPLLITMFLWFIESQRSEKVEWNVSRAELFENWMEALSKREFSKHEIMEMSPEQVIKIWEIAAWQVYLDRMKSKTLHMKDLLEMIREQFPQIGNMDISGWFDVLFDCSKGHINGTFHEQFMEFLVARHLIYACENRVVPYPDFLKMVLRPEINRYFREIFKEQSIATQKLIYEAIKMQYFNNVGSADNESIAIRVHAVYHLSRLESSEREQYMEQAFNAEQQIPVLLSLYFGAIKLGRLDKEKEFFERLRKDPDYSDANRGYHLVYYVPYKIGKLQIQGFSEPTTPKNKITELSHYAEGRPVKTTGGLFAWKARKEAKIF